jgi:hypothetical protein
MPDEISQILRRLDATERNQTDQAKSLTAITVEIGELQAPLKQLEIDREVRKERDKNLNGRLDRIEESIHAVYNLGKWVLAAIGAVLITAVVTFVVKGGLNVGP